MRLTTAVLLLSPAFVVVFALLGIPLLILLGFSVLESSDNFELAGTLTVQNYVRVLTDGYYLSLLGKTLWLSALTTVISSIAGYCLAHFIWRQTKFRGIFLIIVLSPLLVSIVISSYGWVVLLGNNGIINQALLSLKLISSPVRLIYTDAAIVVGLTHITLPFMVLSILASLERIENVLPEAAATLGANGLQVLRHVILPLALPGFAAGTTIVFCLSLSAYVTPSVLGGSGPNFITTLIYNEFITQLRWPVGAALAFVLLAVSLTAVFFQISVMARLARSDKAGGAA